MVNKINVQNRMLEIVKNYDYESEVAKGIETEKELLSDGVFYLDFRHHGEYYANDEEEIAQKMASEVIKYKIKEKIFIKLMSEGIIYPVGIGSGCERYSVKYVVGNFTTNTISSFRRIVFSEFMKV